MFHYCFIISFIKMISIHNVYSIINLLFTYHSRAPIVNISQLCSNHSVDDIIIINIITHCKMPATFRWRLTSSVARGLVLMFFQYGLQYSYLCKKTQIEGELFPLKYVIC